MALAELSRESAYMLIVFRLAPSEDALTSSLTDTKEPMKTTVIASTKKIIHGCDLVAYRAREGAWV